MTTSAATRNTPTWLNSAYSWIRAVAAQRGNSITAPITQFHLRPWSIILRVPTDAGDWYFKAAAAVLANEVPLTNPLTRWIPEAVLPALAVNSERGWMLMPDGGERLREILQKDQDMGYWEQTLPIYAQAQIALADHVAEMLSFGTPDRRLAVLPSQFEGLIADVSTLQVDSDERLTVEELHQLHQLQQFVPRVRDLCAQLAQFPIPSSLHHGDLHDGNIFLRGEKPLFFDWGDASISHPFVSLRTVFVSVEYTFNLPDYSALDYPFRDAYLKPWLQFAPYPDLLEAFRLAQRISPLVSAFSWYRAVASLENGLQREHGLAVHLLLREFLDNVSAIS